MMNYEILITHIYSYPQKLFRSPQVWKADTQWESNLAGVPCKYIYRKVSNIRRTLVGN